MTLVSNPNGLLIASMLFALSGIAVLTRAFWASIAVVQSEGEGRQRKNEALVASWFGFPLLGAAAFLSGVAQFATAPLGAGLACLLLALAFVLLLYAALEGNFADALNDRRQAVVEAQRRPLLSPPKLKTVEVHDEANDLADSVRHALPA
ncbi:MAG: hypothetical protein HOP09_01395 [Hyphomicrobium sp.]|nr:hypothetical protein [Hyphomicrobium sp.]